MALGLCEGYWHICLTKVVVRVKGGLCRAASTVQHGQAAVGQSAFGRGGVRYGVLVKHPEAGDDGIVYWLVQAQGPGFHPQEKG